MSICLRSKGFRVHIQVKQMSSSQVSNFYNYYQIYFLLKLEWLQYQKKLLKYNLYKLTKKAKKQNKNKQTKKLEKKVFLTKLLHVNTKNNNINKIIITAMTKNTSSNRSAFLNVQFNTDTYHSSNFIAAESTPRSYSNDISLY